MLSEQDKTFLGKIFLNYNFTMTTAQLNKEKLYYRDIQRMLDEGLIEKVKRGYYHWIEDYGTSEVAIINSLFPDAVFCMETALFYYKYSDRNPAEWNITVDKNTSRQRTNIDYPFVKAYRVEPALLSLGETDGIIEFIIGCGSPCCCFPRSLHTFSALSGRNHADGKAKKSMDRVSCRGSARD